MKNLFIIDSSNFTNIPASGFSLTIMANAFRIADTSCQMISRFNFNISLLQSLINIFKLIFFKDKDHSIKLKKS